MVGGAAILLLLTMRRFVPSWPRALIVVVLAIGASVALDLTSHGVVMSARCRRDSRQPASPTSPGATRGRCWTQWRIAALNLAGSVAFAVAAAASYFVPETGSVRDLAAANFTTVIGARCFLAGAVGLLIELRRAGG